MTAPTDHSTEAGSAWPVLALNSGSSSLKFGLYRVHASRVELLVGGQAEGIGAAGSVFHASDAQARILLRETAPLASQEAAVARIGKFLADAKIPAPRAIGHRIVHGGPKLRQHCRIDDAVWRELEAATAFAPLHMPAALAVIRYAQAHFPGLAQVACFDTTFHATLPDVARVLPVARELQAQGVQRYGFHGLSCESIVHQLAHELAHGLPERVLIAHLGNGASVTAVKGGRSIDTSMGLTPSGGLIMGTRSGDLDPGLLIYLLRQKNYDAERLQTLVDRQSGLLGISGLASDMRRLHAAAATDADARLAVQMFCACVAKQLAAMITVLDGVDLIVFSGGIGENDALVRAAICSGLDWFGIRLDAGRNRHAGGVTDRSIGDAASRCAVHVVASREDEQIARHTRSLLHPGHA